MSLLQIDDAQLVKTAPAVVRASALQRSYGKGETAVHALRGVSVDVPRGELTAVMGPSGSGKSTLMHILAGLDRPTEGEVWISGTPIGKLNDTQLTKLRREHIGFIFQFFNLLPMLTAAENIVLPLSIAGVKPDREWVAELTAKVGLSDRLGHRPSELSGGQQQRVAIARALVSKPTVMFADEPTGNLDSRTSSEILALLRESVSSYGQTTVMVTHDAHAAAIADRILFLADGQIVKDLGPSSTHRDPRGAAGGDRTMMRVALKGLLGRKLRAFLTGFAIVLGVAMISGSFILTDTLGKSFDGVYDETYKSTDAVISSTQTAQAEDGDTEALSFSAGVLASVRQLPGVGAAQGSIEDDAQLLDKKGKLIGSADNGIGVGFDGTADQSMNPLQVADGRWPQRDGEIAIDRATARKQGYEVGQMIGAYTGGPVAKYRITGILTMGSLDTVAGATIAVFNLPTAERLFDKQGKLDLIRVDAAGRRRPARARAPDRAGAVRHHAGDDGRGAGRGRQRGDAGRHERLQVLPARLRRDRAVRGRVRDRQHARHHGGAAHAGARDPAHPRRLAASGAGLGRAGVGGRRPRRLGDGLFVGLGIAVGLTKLLEATGIALPGGSLVFAPRTVVVSIAVGTFIALLASLRPAIKATRIDPIAAVREGASLPPSRFARFALPVAGLVGAVAIGLFSYGLFAGDLEIKVRLAALIVGVLVLFVGVAMVARARCGRWPTCSARRVPGSAAARAVWPGRTPCATPRGRPPRRPR